MNIPNLVQRLGRSAYWRDVAWLASGSLVAQVIGVAGMPLLTRLYTPDHFALQNIFVQVSAFTVVVSTWRYEFFVQLPKEEGDAKSLMWLVLVLAAVTCAVATPLVWIFREELARLMGTPLLASWLVLVPATASLVSLSVALQNFAQRRGQYRASSQAEVANKSAYMGAALAGYWIFPGATGLMLATAASAVGKIAWLWRTQRPARLGRQGATGMLGSPSVSSIRSLRNMAAEYSHLSGSMVISHLLMSCTAIIPTLFIARAYGTASLGQFTLAAMTIYLPAGLIGNAIGQVYYQRAAERWASGESFAGLWRSTAMRLILIAAPVYAVLALVAPWIYPIIFGATWTLAGEYAALLAVSAFFSFATSPLDRACLVVGAWLYIPLWHAARALSTAAVAWCAWTAELEMREFLELLVAQMSVLFLIDYWAEYRFSTRTPLSKIP